jgi:uncharacterized oxidoreductase
MNATAAALTAIVHRIVEQGGSAAREAELVATNLVEANLRGHDSHGVGMIPRYIDNLVVGALKPNQHVSVARDTGTFLMIDGNGGYGQVAGYEAMNLAIARARETGMVASGLTNAHHIGRIGHWAEQCAAAGLVSIHFVNVLSRPIVSPWGGRDARIGTNPFCVGIPRTDGEPIVVDFATSRSAQGKVRVAYNKGVPLPPGTMIDDAGEPTTDPKYGVVPPLGALLPFGEHKGYALAIACEILGGALSGGFTLHTTEARKPIHNGMFSIVIDPERTGTAANLQSEMTAFVDFVRQSPRQPGVARIRVPGEPERETRRARLVEGISIDDTTWGQIIEAGGKVGVKSAEIEALVARRG